MAYKLHFRTTFETVEKVDGARTLTLGVDVYKVLKGLHPIDCLYTGPICKHIAYNQTHTFCHADADTPLNKSKRVKPGLCRFNPKHIYADKWTQVTVSLAPRASKSFTTVTYSATSMLAETQNSMRFTTTSSSTGLRPDVDGDRVVKLKWSIDIGRYDVMHGFHARHFFCFPDSREVCQFDVDFLELGREGEV